jgi:hydroxymethylbilane synthase
VHSLKDMPAELTPGLAIAAYPAREDPRDALVSAAGALPALPPNSRVGTSSLRRSAQLLAIREDLEIVPVRGNVETRVSAVLARGHKGQPMAAVVLAMAGLRRAGLLVGIQEQVFPLEAEQFVPAAGQGTLAVQIAEANEPLRQVLAGLDDATTRASATAERSVLLGLGADCHSCLAVHVMQAEAGGWRGLAVIGRGDGSDLRRFKCKAASAQGAGEELAALLLPASRELGWGGQK